KYRPRWSASPARCAAVRRPRSAPAHGTRGTSARSRRSNRAQIFTISSRMMRPRARAHSALPPRSARSTLSALCLLCALCAAACSGSLFRQYEYEEDVYLALDGAATVYVNSSIAALNTLRGTTFDATPATRVDTDAVRAYFTTADTRVVR